HVLNIAVKNGVMNHNEAIAKVRKFVNKVWDSTVMSDKLQDFCVLNQMQDELKLLKTVYQDLESSYSNRSEWISINNIIYLLRPMLDATEILSKSSYPTIGDVRLIIKGILQHVKNFVIDKSDSEEECVMAESIKDQLNKYWAIFDHNESTKIATILDSASKLLTFPISTERDSAIDSLKKVIAQYELPELETGATSTSSNNKREKFVSLVLQQATELPTIGNVTGELETYLSTPIIKDSS
ncbi:17469_t:CDS:2, partial [Dentiscutata heterogama]